MISESQKQMTVRADPLAAMASSRAEAEPR
jgi:hypothetical protein